MSFNQREIFRPPQPGLRCYVPRIMWPVFQSTGGGSFDLPNESYQRPDERRVCPEIHRFNQREIFRPPQPPHTDRAVAATASFNQRGIFRPPQLATELGVQPLGLYEVSINGGSFDLPNEVECMLRGVRERLFQSTGDLSTSPTAVITTARSSHARFQSTGDLSTSPTRKFLALLEHAIHVSINGRSFDLPNAGRQTHSRLLTGRRARRFNQREIFRPPQRGRRLGKFAGWLSFQSTGDLSTSPTDLCPRPS